MRSRLAELHLQILKPHTGFIYICDRGMTPLDEVILLQLTTPTIAKDIIIRGGENIVRPLVSRLLPTLTLGFSTP